VTSQNDIGTLFGRFSVRKRDQHGHLASRQPLCFISSCVDVTQIMHMRTLRILIECHFVEPHIGVNSTEVQVPFVVIGGSMPIDKDGRGDDQD
jgi:hypothetical protein